MAHDEYLTMKTTYGPLPRRKLTPCIECHTQKTTTYSGICKVCRDKLLARNERERDTRQKMEAERWRKNFDEEQAAKRTKTTTENAAQSDDINFDFDFDLLKIDLGQHDHIAPEMLRRLIHLCHPDKHGGSEASNTATRFLLGLRR